MRAAVINRFGGVGIAGRALKYLTKSCTVQAL